MKRVGYCATFFRTQVALTLTPVHDRRLRAIGSIGDLREN